MRLEEVEKILSNYSRIVNSAIERIIPKNIDEGFLKNLVGDPSYEFEISSIQKSVIDPFWDLLARGGKRWRPTLSILTYEALGGDDIEEFAEFAAIAEIIHNATLIVDDVEDDSLMRRGKPCIHRIYGLDIAINAGNTLYYFPLWKILSIEDEDKRRHILEAYIRQMNVLSLGQAMDIAWHRGVVDEVSEKQYLQMCAFKTGSVARFAVELACIMMGSDLETRRKLGNFGETIGVAFQIQDDLLNITGEEEKYGKEIGGDITEGKRTLMVVYALRNLSEEESKRLREILNMHTTDRNLINEAVNLIKKSGAVEYAKKVARELMYSSWREADKVLKDSQAKEKLRFLAEYLIERSR